MDNTTTRELIAIKNAVIGNDEVKVVSAYQLYLDLGLDSKKSKTWSKRHIECNSESEEYFQKNVDYVVINNDKIKDYAITIEFAKYLAMQSRSKNANQFRTYFHYVECVDF